MVRARRFEFAGYRTSGLETQPVEVYGLLQILLFNRKSGP